MTEKAIRINATILFLSCMLLPVSLQAQSISQVRSIIFEPVLPGEQAPVPDTQAPGNQRTLAGIEHGQESSGSDQPGPAPLSGFDQYQDFISELELENGPYSAELFQELLSLAYAYQDAGQHEDAIATFERAEHVSRINNGLFSLEQIDSVEGMIESLIASDKMQEADEKQRYLVYLHEQVYGESDQRMVPPLLNLADWNMDAFHEGIRFEAQGNMLAMFGSGFRSEDEVRRQAFGRLRQAQQSYLRAIRSLVDNQEYLDPRLPEMEKNLIETYFLQAYRDSIMEDPDNYLAMHRRSSTGSLIRRPMYWNHAYSYRYGRDAYTRILAYLRANSSTTVGEFTDILIELGDWYILFGRRVLAERKYQEAREIMALVDIPESAYKSKLNPEIPVTLPVFTPTAHTRAVYGIAPDEELDYRGYVDVSFVLTQYGKARRIKTQESSPDTSRAVESRLVTMLRNAQFRPRYSGGQVLDDAEVTLRYYYTY